MPARRGRHPKARGSEPIWTPRAMRSLAEAEPSVFWLDDPAAPPASPSLVGAVDADLVVVGGGYTGLWTALHAKERDPGRDVVLLEAATIGWAASGRNGGFCAASASPTAKPTAWQRFPDEFDTLERLGRENLDGIEADHRALRHRLRLRAHRRARRRDRDRTKWRELDEYARLLRARQRAGPARPRRDRRPQVALADLPRAALWDARRRGARRPGQAGVGAAARRVERSACGSTSTPRSPTSRATAPVVALRAARPRPCGRQRGARAPTPSRRCCVALGPTSCRSTTTR